MCTALNKIRGKTALELLKEYNIKLEPPIDIASLLEKIGISTIAYDFRDTEKSMNAEPGSILGAIVSKDDDLAIFYKKQSTYNRKLFTISHELAHGCLHPNNLEIKHVEFRTDSINPNPHEEEANIFAGELLIPELALIPLYNELIIPSLKYLASLFCVSTTVMAARLDYLNLPYFKDVIINEE